MKSIRTYLEEAPMITPKDFGQLCIKIMALLRPLRLKDDNIFMQPIENGMIIHVKHGKNADRIRVALESGAYWEVSDYEDVITMFPTAFVLTMV